LTEGEEEGGYLREKKTVITFVEKMPTPLEGELPPLFWGEESRKETTPTEGEEGRLGFFLETISRKFPPREGRKKEGCLQKGKRARGRN